MTTETLETKPGYRTSEFWFSVVVALFPVLDLTGLYNWASNWHAGIILAVVTAAYAAARGQAKKGVPFTQTRQ